MFRQLLLRSAPVLLFAASLALIGCAASNAVKPSGTKTKPATSTVKGQTRLVNVTSEISAEFRGWLALANNGDAGAQLQVGTLYDQGEGVANNPQQAVAWFRAAALQGNAHAQHYLGLMYAKGRGTVKDDVLAAEWFGKAAEQGFAKAQYQLGKAYAEGVGVEKNSENSLFWLHKSANQGNSSAQYCLGQVYAKGDGVEKDAEKAAEWMYHAGVGFIEKGHIEAARVALLDIESQVPGHALVTRLRTRLTLKGPPAVTRRPDFYWAGASVGTAWPIAAGYVVTNNHVVKYGSEINLIDANGEMMAATVVERDEDHDLAVLAVKDMTLLPLALPLARQRAYADASVFTVGYPRIDLHGETPKVSAGRVSSVFGLENDPSSYQLNLSIQQGNSGGPLLNTNGEVVGVVTSMLGEIDADGNVHPVPAVSYAVKVQHLRDMLSFLPIQDSSLSELPHYTDTVEALADRIRHSVLIVVAK